MTSGEMEIKKVTLKPLQIVHIAICIAPIMFLMVICLLRSQSEEHFYITEFGTEPFYYVAPIVALSGILISNYLYKNTIVNIDGQLSLDEKLKKYSSALIMRLAPIEAAALFNIIIFYLLGHLLFLLTAIVLLAILISFRPMPDKIAEALKVDYNELN